MDLKRCGMCGVEKSWTEFTLRSNGRPVAYCRPCMSARVSAKSREQRRQAGKRQLQNLTAGVPVGFKRCGACRQVLPVADFPPRGDRPDLPRSLCAACKHQEAAVYRDANRPALRASAATYREAHREELRERQRQWRLEHPQDYAAIHARWKQRNKSAVNAATHRRRNAIAASDDHWGANQWEALKAEYDYTCLMCGRKEPAITLTVDHIVPVSRGGSNGITNIQPLCRSCNSFKHQGVVDLRRRRA